VQQLTLRRDIVEEKETQIKSMIQKCIKGLGIEKNLCFQINVLADYGNIMSAAIAACHDLLA
jgi:hypothetical protein